MRGKGFRELPDGFQWHVEGAYRPTRPSQVPDGTGGEAVRREAWRNVWLVLVCCGLALISPAQAEETLADLFAGLDWVSFAPTHFDPMTGTYPEEMSLREDLQVLCRLGFHGIITYDAWLTLRHIPRLAREACFRGVIMGIWCLSRVDPGCSRERIEAEFRNAVEASPFVDGYAVGNEGLNQRYTRAELEDTVARLKAATGKPVTTSEQIDDYMADQSLLALGDFILPIVHPFWHEVRSPQSAAQWTADQYERLKALLVQQGLREKPVFFKEVGLPTAGCTECSEENQAAYYRWLGRLRSNRLILFAYFEAYDQPWKTWHPVEPHWGLLRSDRSPKKFLQGPRLSLNLSGCTSCRAGDIFSATATVANPSTHILEAKVGFYFPNGTPLTILANRHLELPPGFTFNGEVLRVTVPGGLPEGIWQFGGRLLEPELGDTISESFKEFSYNSDH